ncbi:MAG: hypothetical protein Q9227_001600 [Pyrenula ochraceoflavens]
MANPGQPTPQQMAQMQQQFMQEAAKRGMTPQQFQEFNQQQLREAASKAGMTVEQYITHVRTQQMKQQQQQVQAQGSAQAPGQQQQTVAVNPNNPPKPEALAVAKFLRSQDLKTRTCILDGQRKDMFKVKRALRALQSPAYTKARSKNSPLPEVKDEATARSALQLLPMSMLALRVTKADPHEGHNHAKPAKDPKRVKGLWTVKVERHQEFEPLMHYVWLYEGSQWKTKAYAAGALCLVMALVMFPLWPIVLRQGVWYLSVGMMGLLGLFFAMAIFRLILFCVTVFVVPPGLWLYPNLFEDVGFFDSFRPLWGWQENKKAKKKAKKNEAKAGKETLAPPTSTNGTVAASGASTPSTSQNATKRHLSPRVEEADDD